MKNEYCKIKAGVLSIRLDSRPTTAQQVNEQMNTHAINIYNIPKGVQDGIFNHQHTYGMDIPIRSINFCFVFDLLSECGSFEPTKTRRQ